MLAGFLPSVVLRQSGRLEVSVRMTVSEDQAETEIIPHKSRCLRQSSVAKRLETEKARRQPRVKERTSKKYMSKYRRKTENAKERERMKKFNEAFENLRQKLPSKVLVDNTGEKDTKVMLMMKIKMMMMMILPTIISHCPLYCRSQPSGRRYTTSSPSRTCWRTATLATWRRRSTEPVWPWTRQLLRLLSPLLNLITKVIK